MTGPTPVNLLLITAEPASLLALEAALGELGEKLSPAASAEEALKQLAATDFAAILLDFELPGKGGLGLAQMIRSRPRASLTPIIFLTALDLHEFPVEQAYALGAVDYVGKPINPTMLRARVAVFVELHRMSKQLSRYGTPPLAPPLLAKEDRLQFRNNDPGSLEQRPATSLKEEQGRSQPIVRHARNATDEQRAGASVREGEKKLHESRGLFSLLLESSVDGIYGLKADNSCSFMNVAGAAMLGYRPEELVGQKLHGLIHHHRADGSIYPASECRIHIALQEGVSVRIDDEVFWHKDGRPIPVSYAVSPLLVNGRPSGAVITFSDISKRKRNDAEREHLFKELQTANDRMVEVLKQAPAFICVLRGPDHVFELINDRFLHLVGDRKFLGQPARQALPEIEGQGFFELLDRVYQTGESYMGVDMPVALQRQPDEPLEQRFIDFVFMALRDTDGIVSDILVHGVDQTERHLTEMALRNSEERYRTLFESMDQGFCILEVIFDQAGEPADYRFLELNSMFEKHTGLVNPIGKTIRELVPDHDRLWFEIYGQVALYGEPVRFESEAKAMHRWFDVFATRLGGPDSKKVALLFTDITARKQSEEHRRRLAADLAEMDRRKTEFLATLAHELRNPLAPIRTGLSFLTLSDNNPVAVAKIRDMMNRQGSQMVHLIDDLLDIARITGGKVALKKQRVTLKNVMTNALETSQPFIDAGHHELILDFPDESLVLDADPTRISQVLANLLNNAAKYTPAGGRIEIAAHQHGPEVVISVTDNGVGIPKESLATIFDMFSQVGQNISRAQGGLGIGLSLVRQFVEMHGGTVTGTSFGMGKGSVFTVRLPLASTSVEDFSAFTPQPAKQASPMGARQLRVLVVDDNQDAAATLAEILELTGYTTGVAHDGRQAVEKAIEFKPDVVFLDIGMPGMNGYEAAQVIRKTAGLETTVLVALTGWGDETNRARSKAAGFDHHLSKPVEFATVEALLTNVAATLEKGRP